MKLINTPEHKRDDQWILKNYKRIFGSNETSTALIEDYQAMRNKIEIYFKKHLKTKIQCRKYISEKGLNRMLEDKKSKKTIQMVFEISADS